MTVLRNTKPQHDIYEHQELNILVAISIESTETLKQFWKANKGKSNLPADKIKGFRFVHDDEQDSLKIDFETEEEFEIRHLKKYV